MSFLSSLGQKKQQLIIKKKNPLIHFKEMKCRNSENFDPSSCFRLLFVQLS